MEAIGYYQKRILNFLAYPLIFISAVLCITEGFTDFGKLNFSLLLSCVFAVLLYYTRRRYGLWRALLFILMFAFFTYLLYDNLYELTRALAGWLKGKPILFGALKNLYELVFGNLLSELIYHTEYAKAVVTESGIISGAVDIFKSNPASPNAVTSSYLTGEYFENIFLPPAVLILLFRKLKGKERGALTAVCLLSIIAGDARLFSLVILLINPALYVVYLLVTALSYLSSILLDFRIGFINSASFFELIKYIRNPLFFLLTGIALSVLMYFASLYVLTKFGGKNESS